MNQISLAEARSRIIYAQGLAKKWPYSNKTAEILRSVEHLSYVQIDTISVVERAHHHTLWSRQANYLPEQLNQWVKKKKIFEYWSHAAAYLPMSDFRYTLPRKKRHADGEAHWFKITAEHKKMGKIILDRIKSEGPLQSKDFEKPKNFKAGWFNHSISKQMLEKLYMDGTLMISERQGFQKVYDLTENVLPANTDCSFPSIAEMAQYLIRSCLRNQALATAKEMGYLRRPDLKKTILQEIKKMLISNELIEVKVHGLNNTYYALSEDYDQYSETFTTGADVKILSPFDNLTIQRQRLKDLFNFNYQIECYVPQPKRKYGYFALPLLYKNNFVGVVDAKAHRAEKTLEIVSLFADKKFHRDAEFKKNIQSAIAEFAKFNQCTQVIGGKKILLYPNT